MTLPTLQLLEKKIERHIHLFEVKRGVIERTIEQKIELHKRRIEQKFDAQKKKIEAHKVLIGQKFDAHRALIGRKFDAHKTRIGQKFDAQKKKIGTQIRRFEERNGIKLDDEVRFIRSWFEKPLTTGAVTPSGKVLARTMAAFVDPGVAGPIIELGPGTGPVTEALVAQGVDPARLVLVEYDPTFCRLLKERYPTATVVQGDAYSLRRLLLGVLQEPAAAVVSGLPLFTKPLRMRLRLIYEAFSLLRPSAPFVQFTYAAVPPIPRTLDRVQSVASERIWMNIPPARVWVYRKH
jgi:phosphatidylethanolamine/phosphatidyl-N-methylethanolamine N-methyltransferase